MAIHSRRLCLFSEPLRVKPLWFIVSVLCFSTWLWGGGWGGACGWGWRGAWGGWDGPPTGDEEAGARSADDIEGVDTLIREELASWLAPYADVVSQVIPNEGQGLSEAIILRGAAALSGEALALSPDDIDLIHRLMQYEGEIDTGHGSPTMAYLRRKILRLAPADVVNQEEVIIDRLDDLAGPADQLNALDRFLSPAGSALDDSVRSRLAMLGAMLENENEHGLRVMKYLQRARQLDPANIDAPASLLQLTPSPRTNGEIKNRASLFVDWMKADPFDPAPALALARFLNHRQSFHAARYLGDNLRLIAAHRKRLIEPAVASTISLSILATDGPVRALEFLDDYENRLSQRLQADLLREWDAYNEATTRLKDHPSEKTGHSDITQPSVPLDEVSEIRVDLSIALNIIRLACARLTDNRDRVKTLTAKLAQQMSDRESALRAIINDHAANNADAVSTARTALDRLLTDRIWLRLWLTENNEKDESFFGRTVADDFNELKGRNTLAQNAVDRFDGWIAFRDGRIDEARNKLAPLRQIDPQAILGLALLDEADGDINGAVRWYAEVNRKGPGSLLGIIAQIQMTRLRHRPPIVPSAARVLDELVMRDLTAIREILMHPERMIEMKVEFPDDSIDAPLYQPFSIKLTITNTSSFSLAVEAGRSVDSRVFLELSLSDVNDSMNSSTAVPLGTIARSLGILTLQPGESTHITFRPDRSAIGLPLRERLPSTSRLIARVFLGDPADISSPWFTTGSQLITPVSMTDFTLDLDGSDELGFLRSAAFARALLASDEEVGTRSDACVEALRVAWAHLSDERRAYLLFAIPPSWKSNEIEGLNAFENEVVKPNLGRLSRIVWIMTRIQGVDDPLLIEACGSDDGNVKAVGEFIRSLGVHRSE